MPRERIILASASPRRRQLLEELGAAFEVVTADVPELAAVSSSYPGPADVARENGRLKARAVAALHPGRWVLGADTVVALGTRLLGKPASLEEARGFLQALGGRTHEVITGCALIAPDGREELFAEATRVTFRELAAETIARYLAEVRVLDKAGGYALQERGEWIIAGVEGSRTNVIGLPTERVAELLRARGLL